MTGQEALLIAFQVGEYNVDGNTDAAEWLATFPSDAISVILHDAADLEGEKNGEEARKVVLGMGALALNELGRRQLNKKVTFS